MNLEIQFSCEFQNYQLCNSSKLSIDKKQGKSEGFDSCDGPSDPTQIGSKSSIFSPCDHDILWTTSENIRAPLLYFVKRCATLQSHRWIQIEVTLWKHSIRVKIGDFLSHVTFKFDGWLWKTIRHPFSTTPSFVHHFKAIGELKLGWQFGSGQFGSKLVTLKFDGRPWKTTGNLFYAAASLCIIS